MENNKDNGELSAKELAPDSLAYELAKSKESENLLGDIRKQTQATLRVLKNWKLEDISRLELNLNKDSERFSKLRETIGTQKKKPIPKEKGEPGANKPQEKRPQEKRPEEKKPQEKRPEEKKPQEKRPSPEQDAKRKADFEKERSTRYRQLRDRGVPADEARRRAYDDTVKAQKYKPEVSAEPPKAKPSKFPFELPKLELPKINLPKFNLPKPQLPKVNLPKPQLPKLKLPELNENQLKRQGFLNKLVGKIFDVKDVFDLGTSAAKRDIGGVLSSGAGLLSNFKKFSPLAYFDAYRKLYEKDVAGAAESAAITRASGSLISRGTGLLARVPALSNLAKAGPYAAAIGGGLLVGSELVKLRKEQDRKEKERIQRQIEALEKAKRGETKMVYPTEFKQGPRNWWESLFPPRMAEGGVVTKPTLALIGEGNEEEYIVPQSKLASFVSSQSNSSVNDDFNKPARIILGVANNFVSQFGSASGDVRRMVGSDILRLERIFGKEKFVLPIFVKGEGSFDNIIGDVFSRLTKFGGSTGGVIPELYDAVDNLLFTLDEFLAEAETMGAGGGFENGGAGLEGGDMGTGEIVGPEGSLSGGQAGELLATNAKTSYYDPSLGGINASGYKTREGLPATSTGEGYRANVFSAAAFPPLLAKLPRNMTVPSSSMPGRRTLRRPFNVVVTNSQGKTAVIRVNDVGPGVQGHASNHMLDLSVAAKNYLGTGGGFTIKFAPANSTPGPLRESVSTEVQPAPSGRRAELQSQPNIIAQIYGTQLIQQQRPARSLPQLQLEIHADAPGGRSGLIESLRDDTNNQLFQLLRAEYGSFPRGYRDLGGPKRGLSLIELLAFNDDETRKMQNRSTRAAFVDRHARRLFNVLRKYNGPVNLWAGHADLTTGSTGTSGTISRSVEGKTTEQLFNIMVAQRVAQLARASGRNNITYTPSIIANAASDPNNNWLRAQRMRGNAPSPSSQITTQFSQPSTPNLATQLVRMGQRYQLQNPSGRTVKNYTDLGPHHDYQTRNREGQTLAVKDINLLINNSTDVPVPSPVTGKVQLAGYVEGFGPHTVYLKDTSGNLVIIGHMKSKSVRAGQPVTVGQPIGIQGSLGRSSGPHVHIEAKPSIISSWINGMVSGQYTGSVASTSDMSISPSSSGISANTSTGPSPARVSAARAEISRLRRRIPGLNGVPRRRPNRVSALQAPTSLSTTVAVQPVIIQQPVPTQQTASSENVQRTAPRISTNWTPIVVTG